MTFERPVSAPPPPRPPPPDILEESSLLNNLQEIMQLCVPGAPGWRPPGSARAAARRAQRVACDAPSPCCYMRGHISRTIMLGAGSDTALDPRDADASRPASPAPVQMPSTSLAAETCSQDDIQPELDTEILALLGDAPKSDIQFGKPTHKDLASRWQDILEKGLLKDVKEKILDSYLIPENCSLLVAPTLNPEVKVALAENMVKRDASLQAKQKQESIAIAALNQAIELIIAKENHTKILKPISDACRLLCDSHFNDTRTRRGFIISAINPELKDTLSETKRDKLLFGENVSEKLKSAKTIKNLQPI
ncbi:hypothetical protein MSG28_000670 [Choristoneura fumiferana]|uniref:Uncharacterized protein n=1 Tax=Choristoneura fumiferana TaxID=7141 RepID=A0ACC0K2A0_CHOFU|nr:hypothetical protein MSG28_000670 [Choristoneura fumiferana]